MRGRRGGLVATFLGLAPVLLAVACASILGYDDLSARKDEAPTPEIGADVVDDVPAVEAEIGPDESVRPPARPPGTAAPSGKGKTLWLAVKRFYLSTQSLGSTISPDGGGTPTSKEAWKDFGYDIDHVCTGEAEAIGSIGTCKKNAGSPEKVLLDGNSCRDNNFGSQMIPIVATFNSVFEDDSNQGVLGGANTLVLALEDLDDGENDPYVVGKLYRVSNILGYPTTKPKWNGSDIRQADRASLDAGDITKPRAYFPKGYVTNNTWVSGEPSKFIVPIPVNSVSSDLHLGGAVMTLKLASNHSTGNLGVLAGALARADLELAIRPIARSAGVCTDSLIYKALINSVQPLMDVVMESPTLQDTTVDCNGMSVGMGLEFANVQPITEAVDIFPFVSPCDDAGTGG